MGALTLRINEPLNGTRIAAAGDVRLRGEVVGGYTGVLYFKWYSTLNPAPTNDHPELNPLDHGVAKLNWTTPLRVGSHVISFSAADREQSDLASVQAVTQAGFSGGAPDAANPTPCVVHRLIATLHAPSTGATVSRASLAVEMEAPARWYRKLPNTPWELDPDYHAVNRVRFSFRVDPVGAPAGRLGASVTPTVAALVFDPTGTTPHLKWQGALGLSRAQDVGAYTFTLTVDTPDGPEKHQAAVNVTLTL